MTTAAGDAGQFVGVSTSNVGTSGSFLDADDYTLAITTVPEPETWSGMLTVGMVTGLIVARRRKRTLSRNLSV